MEIRSDQMPLKSILLVEDDECTLDLLVTIINLKFSPVALYCAVNGRAGLELFDEHKPDIVITDINMPEMDGVQLAGKIRASKLDSKVIVLTANTGKIAMEHDNGEAFEVDHFILKPIDFGLLFTAIKQCFGDPVHQVCGYNCAREPEIQAASG